MDISIGIVGSDFVLLATDMAQIRSIVVLKSDEDKILELDRYKLMALCGENGDRVTFSQYIQKNLSLYNFRNNSMLSTHGASNFTRKELATALRKNPYLVDILIAGWDEGKGTSLYYIDYLASMTPVSYAAHGYASFFLSGLLDRYWKQNMNLEEAKELLKMCLAELKMRFLVNANNFVAKYVDKEGHHVLDLSF